MSYEVIRDDLFVLIFILLCPMALYSGAIHLKIILYSRFKKEQFELLWIQAVEPLLTNYLKNYSILTLHSQYTYCLFMFVSKADTFLKQILMFIIAVHDIILICTCLQLIQQSSKMVSVIWELKMYNHLPQFLKNLSHDARWFRLALKRILLKNAFYCLEEYLSCKSYDWLKILTSV